MLENLEKLQIVDVMNNFSDWKERIQADPFNITVKENDNYILLKYSQFASDMSYQLVRECRGSIFKKLPDAKYEYVCRPFDKFFNYGETFAAEIDWSTARVTEKVDGSLCKLFFDAGRWRLATNGTIDAFTAPVGDAAVYFGDIFERAAGVDIQTLGSTLDKSRTYMFELTSPETQVVIYYPDGVYYLTSRSTETGEEFFDIPKFHPAAEIKFPKQYYLNSLDDVIAAAMLMSKDEEGFVVNDAKGNRIKVKSPEYLVAEHLAMNGAVTNKRIFEMIRDEKIDDFLAYIPQCKDKVDKVLQRIDEVCDEIDREWNELNTKDYASRRDFALAAAKLKYSKFHFLKYDDSSIAAKDFLFRLGTASALKHLGYKE